MATKKKEEKEEDKVDGDEPLTKEIRKVSVAKKAPTKKKVIRPAKKITFSKYMAVVGAKEHHIPGMRAFVKDVNVPRTKEEWDTIFKSY